MPHAPTPRRGEHLDPDHPLADDGAHSADCISDVDPDLLDALARWHDYGEPPDSQVDPAELV